MSTFVLSSTAVFLRTVPEGDSSVAVPLCLSVCGFICGVCVHYLFLISPSFGASGGLYLANMAFPGYLHIFLLHFFFFGGGGGGGEGGGGEGENKKKNIFDDKSV